MPQAPRSEEAEYGCIVMDEGGNESQGEGPAGTLSCSGLKWPVPAQTQAGGEAPLC